MMDDAWKNLAQYLGAMNGENTKRRDYVTTPEAEKAEKKLIEKEKEWESWLASLSERDRTRMEEMKDCMEEYQSAHALRSYIQGYVDCVQVLYQIGLLKIREE